MSDRRPWLRFERRGGSPPRDDEELTLAEDGSFAARRTIGGPRIGAFEGQLSKATLARLRPAVEAVGSADDLEDLTLPTPRHGATEVLEVVGRTLRLGSNESPPKPWRSLLDRVRKLLEDEVVDRPLAAVELVATVSSARLVHAGSEPIELDTGTVVLDVVRVADDGAVLARWRGRRDDRLVDNGETLVATPEWVTAGRGWSAPLPWDHPLELAPGDWLQVWVDLAIRDADGRRQGKLYAPVLTDG